MAQPSDPAADAPQPPPAPTGGLHNDPTRIAASPRRSSKGGPHALPAGAVFGHYTIESVLGEGGMGVVYRARQERPAREVALKVIRPGLASSQALHRFELEAEVLGRLQHPGIAQVFEAGTTPDGQPFFAMELVGGDPLTLYAESHQLSMRQRLELFARICDAVQHAHTKGVIHRDLKPVNILVDSAGQPKILDFGVARLTQHDVQVVTIQTDFGQIIGTVPYMSPEQIEGDSANLDTRSDVYALGVILYELLTGRMPYDLSKKLIHEAARIIQEDEPTRLSSINRALRGDIETIALKALEKDKARRYQAASDLGSDITRFLRDEPIVARPASRRYQLRKFAQRNKALVGGVVAAIVLLTAGLIGTSYGLVQANRQRVFAEQESQRAETQAVEAQRQAAIAQAVNDFLNRDLLGEASPELQPDPDVKLRTVLDRAAERVHGGASGPPEVEAELRLTIGRVYSHLGVEDAAQSHLRRALEIFERIHGPRSLRVADTLHALAYSSGLGIGLSDRADQCRRALSIRQELLPPGDPLIALTMADLNWMQGYDHLGHRDEIYPDVAMGMLAMARGRGESIATVRALAWRLIADVERDVSLGNWALAEQRVEQSVAPLLALPPLRPRVPVGLAQVASDLGRRGYPGTARSGAMVAARLAISGMPENDPVRALALAIALPVAAANGPTEGLIEMLDEGIRTVERCREGRQTVGPNTLHGFGMAAHRLGRSGDGQWLLSDAYSAAEESHGFHSRTVLESLRALRVVCTDQSRFEEAERLAEHIVAFDRTDPEPLPNDVVKNLEGLAIARLNQGDLTRALAELQSLLADQPLISRASEPVVRSARSSLARVLGRMGRLEEAQQIECSLIDDLRSEYGPGNAEALRRLAAASRLAREQGFPEEGRRLAQEGLDDCADSLAPDHVQMLKASEQLALALVALNRFELARDVLDRQWKIIADRQDRAGARRDVMRAQSSLYTAWHTAEPGQGHDAKAAQWREALDAPAPAHEQP